jgi:outer membrane protein TolC
MDSGYKGPVRSRPRPLAILLASLASTVVGAAAVAQAPLDEPASSGGGPTTTTTDQPSSETDEEGPALDGPPVAPDAGALALPDLLEAARRYYPSLEAATYAVEAARAQLREAQVSPFFQFNVEGAFGPVPNVAGTPVYSNDSQLNLGGRWNVGAGIQVEGGIPLYTFGKLRNLRRAARQGILAAEAQRTVTLRDLELDVRRAYFALQLALDIEQMVNEGLHKLEQAEQRLEERLQQGDTDVDPLDRYRMQAAIAEVRGRASQAEYLRIASQSALITLTGVARVRIPDCPSQPLTIDLRPVTTYLEGLAELRPEARMLDAAVEAREAQLGIERARFFPDIGLGLNAGISVAPGRTNIENPFIRDAGNTQSLSGGLIARWNLDLWGTNLRVRRRRAELRQTEAQRRQALSGMELEVREAFERLRDAQRREDAYGEGERATRRWFISAAQAYQVGTLEPKQLIDAVTAYFTNRFNHLQAIHDYNVAASRLDKATGSQVVAPDAWGSSCEE